MVQIFYTMMPPIRHWWPYYRMYKCYRNKCPCIGRFSLHDVPPNIMQAMKDDAIAYEFVNSTWNFIENKNMSPEQRTALNIIKYFNGVRSVR